MLSTIHSCSAILVFLTLLLFTLAADLPAYPLVCTILSAVVFCQRLTVHRPCETHIYRVGADFEIFYRIYN